MTTVSRNATTKKVAVATRFEKFNFRVRLLRRRPKEPVKGYFRVSFPVAGCAGCLAP